MPAKPSVLWQRRLTIGLLLLVAAVLARIPNLNESLWYDEVCYTSVLLKGASFKRILFHDIHPPLYPLLMKGWIALFGESEIFVRLPSLLFGLASLWVLFALTQAWFGRRVGFLATVLMAFSPVHIWYSQENKNNMLLLFLTLLTVYGLHRAWVSNKAKHWLLFILSAILALYTNHFSLWTVLAAFIWLGIQAVRDPRHRSIKWIAVSAVAVALAYLPLIILILRGTESPGKEYLRPFTFAELYNLFLIYLSHGNTLRTVPPYAPFRAILEQHWGFFFVDGFFALLLAAGLCTAVRQWLRCRKESVPPPDPGPAETELLLLTFLVPPVALLVASYFYPENYIERSMIFLLPPFLILIASGVMALPRPWWRYAVITTLFLVNIVSLANYWVLKKDAWTVYKPNPDWRAFARDLRHETDKTVVFTSCPTLAMENYLKDSAIVARWLGPSRNANNQAVRVYMWHQLNRYGIRYPQYFYVVLNKYWGDSYARKLNDALISRVYALVEKKQYFGLEVYKYGFYR
jgi:4-amino-4-deoxy-L-arabinose transferase-like glycosyltransferase